MTQVILFSFMVYLKARNFFKMKHGGNYPHWLAGSRRQDNFQFQKKSNDWQSRLWGTHNRHSDHEGGRGNCRVVSDENLPQPDRLERSLLKRGASRRTYQIRILETRYPCENQQDAPKPAKPGSRDHKNSKRKSPRPLHGDKSAENSCGATNKEESATKRICRDNRRIVDDTVCGRFFQALANDLLIEWLTPREVHNIEIAFQWEYDWGRAWHGGRVRDKVVAAHIQYDLQQGLQAEFLLNRYNRDFAFSAFWYLVDVGEIDRLANKYKHYKTLRKICQLI